MSTMANRPAVETYKGLYGSFTFDPVFYPVIAPQNHIQLPNDRALTENLASLNNARQERLAAELLRERFGVPLCLEAIQPFLIIMSKELEAIDWERQSAFQAYELLENLIRVTLTQLMTLAEQRKRKEQEIASLQTTAKDLQADRVHDVLAPMADKTQQRANSRLKQLTDSVDALKAEAERIEQTVMELVSMKDAITQEIGKLSGWQTAPAMAEVNKVLQM